MTKSATLLVEILTEELPPLALEKMGNAFAQSVFEQLKKQNFLNEASFMTAFASPRRLACTLSEVKNVSPDQQENTRLLPAKIGLDENGEATAPLNKKLAALQLDDIAVEQLECIHDGKQDMLHIKHTIKGQTLQSVLPAILEEAIKHLPIPKVMSYQRDNGETIHFARPAHRLLTLHGNEVIPATVLGLTSDRKTMGHRFLSPGELQITSADNYEIELETQGKVIASFAKRQQQIIEQLEALAKDEKVIKPDSLVNEVTALVEWPMTYEGYFDQAFLKVPQECLILTMQANQKYFALTQQNGEMSNRFLLVSNIQTPTPELIINGNERVLRARLADAKFFFDQDKKHSLESRLPKLSSVIYHNKLGNQHERNDRIVLLAQWLAKQVDANPELAKRAALLSKADLLTEMVGEFPELQGTMGEYYAKHDNEPEAVGLAIADHYCPRFSGDKLPRNAEGITVALADKLETLVGIFGIGLLPTGDKDPFALRRHALGVIRILIENQLPLSIHDAVSKARDCFKGLKTYKDNTNEVYLFLFDRLKGHLRDRGYQIDEVNAVLRGSCDSWLGDKITNTRLDTVINRLEAVHAFSKLPEAEALAAANKRITNILKKNAATGESANLSQHLVEPAEKVLYEALSKLKPKVDLAMQAGDYTVAMQQVAPLKELIDQFFDTVMVMTEDDDLRHARIWLLHSLYKLMNQVAFISELAN